MLGGNNVKMYGQENAVVMFEGNVDIMFSLHEENIVCNIQNAAEKCFPRMFARKHT